MPMPSATWGRIVQATEAVGRNASAAAPAATSSAPATARVPAGPPIRAAASALIGITLTTSAAASGSMLQPLISRRTVRNSAAAMAPETSAERGELERRAAGREARAPRYRRAGRREACRHGRERGGNLDQEDRPPAERLGERAADGRARGRAQQRRLAPEREALSRRAPPVADQHRVRGHRAAPLRRAPAPRGRSAAARSRSASPHTSDPAAEQRRPRPGRARGCHTQPPSRSAGSSAAASTTAYTPSTAATPATSGVELGENGRQGERDDRRVGQGKKGDARQRETCRPRAADADRHAHELWLGGRARAVVRASRTIDSGVCRLLL